MTRYNFSNQVPNMYRSASKLIQKSKTLFLTLFTNPKIVSFPTGFSDIAVIRMVSNNFLSSVTDCT